MSLRRKPAAGGQIIRVKKMKPYDLKSMSVDELLSLHEFVTSVLARKISAEKARLDQRLRQLRLDDEPHKMSRRPYPPPSPVASYPWFLPRIWAPAFPARRQARPASQSSQRRRQLSCEHSVVDVPAFLAGVSRSATGEFGHGHSFAASGVGVRVSVALADAIPALEPDALTVRPVMFPASSLVG